MKKIILTVTIILASIIFMSFIIVGQNHEQNYEPYFPSVQNKLIVEFDGNTKLSGAQVIAAIRKYYTNKDLIIVQENGRNYSINASKAVENYTGGTPPYSTEQTAIEQVKNNLIIRETYSSKLIYSGKRIVGIQFIQNL